uniref:Uncharacterized protein n=1 Tax=Pararge aegeria TaxID=116150 RepID=S4NRQ3_9NEOP
MLTWKAHIFLNVQTKVTLSSVAYNSPLLDQRPLTMIGFAHNHWAIGLEIAVDATRSSRRYCRYRFLSLACVVKPH